MSKKRRFISLPGFITILHLLAWVGVVLWFSLSMHGIAVWHGYPPRSLEVPRIASQLLSWPLAALIGWPDHIVGLLLLMTVNSLLVGYGLAGAIRMVINRQYGLKTLLFATVVASFLAMAIRLESANLAFWVCTIVLVCLAIVGVAMSARKVAWEELGLPPNPPRTPEP